jgi:hypothetical protein
MKFSSILLPAAALLGATLLLLPGTGQAYAFLGGSLDLTQRDFRVHNNFTDVEANNNLMTDPQFPGATGAVRAIWAAVSEWGSELRRDGAGDTSQPGGLGSGGANFDSIFQGEAPDPGGIDDNVFSEIGGMSGGVLAYTEIPISDGWRIRFFRAPIVWHDGPGPPVGSDVTNKDLQGVATHEYGHALGLDHSTIALEVVMFPGSSTNFYQRRTLHADDIAGVQALYGVRSATKPHIESYVLNGNQLTIIGDHFDATDNEVWFTRAGGLGDGTPVKLVNLASTQNGTQIDALIPATAGHGDVLVRVPGDTGDKLSNSYPFDPIVGDCPGVISYGTPMTNSTGLTADLVPSGLPSVSQSNFNLDVSFGGVANAPAILFYGSQQASTPFFGGTLYAGGPLKRAGSSTFGTFGDVYFTENFTTNMIGQTRFYQLWYKDAAAPGGVGLSGGVQVTICP